MPTFRMLHAAGWDADVPLLNPPPRFASVFESALFESVAVLIDRAIELEVDAVVLMPAAHADGLSRGPSHRAEVHLRESFARLSELGIAGIIAVGANADAWKRLAGGDENITVLAPGDVASLPDRDGSRRVRFRCVDRNATEERPASPNDAIEILLAPSLSTAAFENGTSAGSRYLALGAGERGTVALRGGIAHSPGPLQSTGKTNGPRGATLATIEATGQTRTGVQDVERHLPSRDRQEAQTDDPDPAASSREGRRRTLPDGRGSDIPRQDIPRQTLSCTPRTESVPCAVLRFESITVEAEPQDAFEDLAIRMTERLDDLRGEPCELAWLIHWTVEAAEPLFSALNDPCGRGDLVSLLPENVGDLLCAHQVRVVPHAIWPALDDPFAAELEAALQERCDIVRKDRAPLLALPESMPHRKRLARLVGGCDLPAVLGDARRFGLRVTSAAKQDDDSA